MNQLRMRALEARRSLSDDERGAASRTICENLVASRLFRSSSAIACYLAAEDEVDTAPIIERAWRANKRVFAPVLRKRSEMSFVELRADTMLRRNRFGIWEPCDGEIMSPRCFDFVVAPTVAFDDANNRIGMGGGYFDRCFAYLRYRKFWLRPKLVGVAFECQKVEKIAPNTWDIPLYRVFTENDKR